MTGSRRLIVVGGGTAGIPAALEGLRRGAEVVLIDKGDRLGGMLWASGAVLSGAGSRLQRSKGILDSANAHEEEVWEVGRRRADRALLHLAARDAGSTIDWLEALGVRFQEGSPMRLGLADEHEVYDTPRSYVLDAPDELGPYRGPVLADALIAALRREKHGRLELRLDCTAVSLVGGPEGRIGGCRVRDAAGSESVVTGDAVILATGGYAANQELLRRFHGRVGRIVSQGLAHATGDGLVLAEATGAQVVNDDIVVPMLGAVEDPDRPGFRLTDTMVHIGRPAFESGDIWVNADGRRFFAEDDSSPDRRERAVLAQPGGAVHVVFDDAMRRGLTDNVRVWTASHLGDPPDPALVRSAGTLAGLATLLGVPATALEETVRSYNAGVAEGADPLDRRALPKALDTPPFHGVPTVASIIVTFAGVRVNERLEVMDGEGQPIGGLYAVGELLGGGQVQGDGFSSGMSVTPAIAFGRWAAECALASC